MKRLLIMILVCPCMMMVMKNKFIYTMVKTCECILEILIWKLILIQLCCFWAGFKARSNSWPRWSVSILPKACYASHEQYNVCSCSSLLYVLSGLDFWSWPCWLITFYRDEELLFQGLALNDELQCVLQKHDDMLNGVSTLGLQVSETSVASLVNVNHEDDGSKDFSQLSCR